MPHDMDYDADGLRGDLRASYHESAGPAPDEIDRALATLREARRILADTSMMSAIRARIDESKAAVAAGNEE